MTSYLMLALPFDYGLWTLILPLLVVIGALHHSVRKSRRNQEILRSICQLAKDPCQEGNKEKCKELMVKYDVHPNDMTSTLSPQWTPFMAACYGGSLELMEFMMDLGADSSLSTKGGDGALYLATYGILVRLKKANTLLLRSKEVQTGTLIIDCLVNTGCNINQPNKQGYAPLHWAAAIGEKWLVDLLLRRGADPNLKLAVHSYPADCCVLAEN